MPFGSLGSFIPATEFPNPAAAASCEVQLWPFGCYDLWDLFTTQLPWGLWAGLVRAEVTAWVQGGG